MPDYTVTYNGTAYYRWRNNTVKARENNLNSGYPVSGDVVGGSILVIEHTLPGAEEPPPYAMYLSTLTLVTSTPPPPEQEPDTIMIGAHQVQVRIGNELVAYQHPEVTLTKA